MANHKSSEKRIRQTAKRRLANRYYGKTTRNAIRKIQAASKSDAQQQLSSLCSMLDKLAKRGVIHANKAANQKSRLTLMVSRKK
jgi:small subunit ribosomal protein S20